MRGNEHKLGCHVHFTSSFHISGWRIWETVGLKWVAGSGGVPEITTSWGCILLLDEYVRLQLYRDRKRLQGRAQAVYKVCTVYCIQPSAARLCRFALDNMRKIRP